MSPSPAIEVSGITADASVSAVAGVRGGSGEAASAQGPLSPQLEALQLGEKAMTARQAGDESKAEHYFNEAVVHALRAIDEDPDISPDFAPHVAEWALNAGDVSTARQLLAGKSGGSAGVRWEKWQQIADVNAWPDPWLVAAVRRATPDEAALDALAARYWKVLFARCQMLALNHDAAADLAQDTWCRVLRSRDRLRPGGNFRAYLLTVATNLWRDSQRAALRAGALAEGRVASLDRAIHLEEGTPMTLADLLPDVAQLEAAGLAQLKGDLDHALERLSVLWRDVLVARFLDDESCASIGRRYGRTEQTASGWIRQAISELKLCLEDARRRSS